MSEETPQQEYDRLAQELRNAEQYLAKELRAMCGCSAKGRARNLERKNYTNTVINPLKKRIAELRTQLGILQ